MDLNDWIVHILMIILLAEALDRRIREWRKNKNG